jgi:glycosyltransferase involved in cell wall biosynthesis
MSYKTSVIITTYNRKEYLGRALNSVYEQSVTANEIIVIDDGSSDGTEPFIKKNHAAVKFFWQKNSGVSSARNLGIKKATYEWITFLDSDDAWLPKKLENQFKTLEQNPSFKLCHTDEIWIRNGKRANPMKKHQKSGGTIFKNCLPLCVISPSSAMLHRSLFEIYGGFDEDLPVCEDYDLWLRICAFLPVLYIEKPQIIKYGGHADQLSHKYWGMDRFRIQSLEKIINIPDLKVEDKLLATKVLLNKIKIYITGAKKRDKLQEVAVYTDKMTQYEALLSTLS